MNYPHFTDETGQETFTLKPHDHYVVQSILEYSTLISWILFHCLPLLPTSLWASRASRKKACGARGLPGRSPRSLPSGVVPPDSGLNRCHGFQTQSRVEPRAPLRQLSGGRQPGRHRNRCPLPGHFNRAPVRRVFQTSRDGIAVSP